MTLAVLAAGTMLSLGACNNDGEQPSPNDPPTQSRSFKLLAAPNCQTLGTRIVDASTEQILRYRYEEQGLFLEDSQGTPNTPTEGGGGARGEEGPTDYTTTNNQEAGVDEADIIKTDGKHVYTLNGGDLVIL